VIPTRLGKALVALASAACVASTALATTDVPVAGQRLSWRTSLDEPERRRATIVLDDPAIALPLPDPRAGAAVVVSAGAALGQCWQEIALDPAKWRAIGDDGSQRGYEYRDHSPGTVGVRRIVMRPGKVVLEARGPDWPCTLDAPQQRTPVSVVLRIDATRYCAAFGGTVAANGPGRVLALAAPAPAACPQSDLTVADLNILHGVLCPRATRQCRLADRMELFFQWIVASGCPDVVTLQEVSTQVAMMVAERAATACPFTYQIVHQRSLLGIDDEMIMTRYPTVTMEVVPLYRDFRHMLFVRVDHPLGPVDVLTTHMASSSDDAEAPCATDCPPECVAAGAATVRDCQSVQVARYMASRHDVTTPAVVTGDFNDVPGSFVYRQFSERGWIDVYLAAGNPECDADTGVGCTSGREDEDVTGLESSTSNQVERIDYIFLVPPGPAAQCRPSIDTPTDGDGDQTATRIFSDTPNPFAPSCGPAPAPICWPSDHEGMELDLNCGT